MEGVLEAHENSILFGALVGAFFVAAAWEAIWPRRKVQPHLVQRWAGNIGLGITNQVLIYWLDAAATIAVAWWVAAWNIGLLADSGISVPVALIITVLALEMTAYFIHRLMHTVPWLWRVHAVHHSDTELDFTTTARNHPLELLLVVVMSTPVIALLGPPVAVIVLYQVTRTSVNILAHSNVYLPEWIERWLRYLLVTPDFHRLHHSDDRKFTDSNFGAFVPWFDYLFGTATRKPFSEHPAMTIGLEYFREPGNSRFDRMLIMPFHWRREAQRRKGAAIG